MKHPLKITPVGKADGVTGSHSAAKNKTVSFNQAEIKIIRGKLSQVGEVLFGEGLICGQDQEWKLGQGRQQLAGIIDKILLIRSCELGNSNCSLPNAVLFQVSLLKAAVNEQAKGWQNDQQNQKQ